MFSFNRRYSSNFTRSWLDAPELVEHFEGLNFIRHLAITCTVLGQKAMISNPVVLLLQNVKIGHAWLLVIVDAEVCKCKSVVYH